MREYLEEILVVAAIIVAGVLWCMYYVGPNEDHLFAVANCVEERGSHVGDEATWNECHDELVPQAGALVQAFHPARR